MLERYANPFGFSADPEKLLMAVSANRHGRPIDIPDLGPQVGLSQIPFIMARVGLVGKDANALSELGLTTDYVEASFAAATSVSEAVATSNIRLLEEMKIARPELDELLGDDPIRNLFVAANIGAERSHAGQTRKVSLSLPYIFHARALEAINCCSAEDVARTGIFTTEEILSELLFINTVSVGHDATEKVLKPNAYWRLTTHDIMTPADIAMMALRLQVDSATAKDLQQDSLGLIVFPGPIPDGFQEASWYQEIYIGGMTDRAKVVKQADMKDNDGNPKDAVTDDELARQRYKNRIYQTGMNTMPSLLPPDSLYRSLAQATLRLDPQRPRDFFGDIERTTANDVLTLLRHSLAI